MSHEWITALFGLAGTLVGAAVSLLTICLGARLETKSQREARRTEFLRLQLQELYSPLNFYTLANRRIFNHTKAIDKALSSVENLTPGEKNQTCAVKGDYEKQLRRNNDRIAEVLWAKSYLMDLDDRGVLLDLFLGNYERIHTEFEGSATLPSRVKKGLGGVDFVPKSFEDTVLKRFEEKAGEYASLRKV